MCGYPVFTTEKNIIGFITPHKDYVYVTIFNEAYRTAITQKVAHAYPHLVMWMDESLV